MDDNDNVNKPDCCDGGQCCSPVPGGGSSKPTRWKTMLFSGVIVLACVVAAYSLFWRSNEIPAAACCPPGSAAAAACAEAAAKPGFDHTSAPVGLSLVVLTNNGEAISSDRLVIIGEVRESLETYGSQLQFETIESGDTAFQRLVNQYGVAAFPTLIAAGEDKVLVLGESQVNADTILSVFKAKSASRSGAL